MSTVPAVATVHEIVLTVPADDSLLRFCRVSVSAAAATLDFDLDQLDDVRTAVGEAVGLLLQGFVPPVGESDPGRIELRIRLHLDAVEVHGVLEHGVLQQGVLEHAALPPCEESDLTAALLGATVDEYSFDLGTQRRSFHMVKRRTP